MRWQCPKCKQIYGSYYVKQQTECEGCGLNVCSFQPYAGPRLAAAHVAHIGAGAANVGRAATGRTTPRKGAADVRL